MAMAAAVAPVTASSLSWSSSAGSGAPRDREALLRLHRLRFVERRGHDASLELIEERRSREARKDADRARAYSQQMRRVKEAGDKRMAQMSADGSFTFRSKQERDAVEEKRQDPDEALAKMTKHMREVAVAYKDQKAAMTARVGEIPNMSVRTKEELARIEEARQDPKEAAERMTKHMAEVAHSSREELAALTARVQQRPRETFWTKEQREHIEELRQDPDEAREKMEKHTKELSRSWRDERSSMAERVSALPAMSFRSREQRERIEEARQDPQEAAAAMRSRQQERRQAHKAEIGAMMDRVMASPRRMTRWTKEEQEKIEELRQDPEEARTKATQMFKEQAQAYRELKKEMQERVSGLPRKTFQDTGKRSQLEYAAELKRTFQARGA